jgi:glycyl-tRNA synthetase beta chain
MLKALLEIGCEEIPARFMPGFLKDLKEKAELKLKDARLSFSKIETLGTYRRLTLYIEGLPAKQDDLSREAKGPPAAIAFDAEKKPTKAAIGFAKTQGVKVDQLIVKSDGKKDYIYADVLQKGMTTPKALSIVFPEIINSLHQPLAMRWGELDFKFIRPIHWIAALCGNKVVKFKLAGITSGNKTKGHRYFKNPKSQILNPNKENYIKLLKKKGVIVDQEERKALIRGMIDKLSKKKALIEKDLLSEVTFLTENPIAYVGKINKEFLTIPKEVLITSMKKNQKYFPILDGGGTLAGQFVVVTDGCKSKSVVEGNQKVLLARLSDAKFFFEEDQKQPLKERVPALKGVGFFKGLGSMLDKSERIAKLSEWLGKRLELDDSSITVCRRISELCKADLTTKMVYEFPVLQGVVGKQYALLSGEDPKVAAGILEHYLPRFAEDKIPASKEGTIVALADRIDSIVGCFSIGNIPSGSVDPYGLRRAAHGIIRIVLGNKLDILLDELIDHSYRLYKPMLDGQSDFSKIKNQVLGFITGRVKPLLLDRGIRYDIVDAVLTDFNDILDVVIKAGVISKMVSEKWFPGVVMSADRISKIAGKVTREEVLEEDLAEKEEKELHELYLKVNWEVGEAIKKEDWEKAVKSLTALTDPIELFFEKILVMHKDERLKANRLALLKSLDNLYLRVADFKKIVFQG